MTYPPGGTPDPYQPQQPYGQQPYDPTTPYSAEPSSGQPYGQPSSGQPYGAPSSGQPYGQPPPVYGQDAYKGGQPYGQPGYGQPYAAPVVATTNTMAILALVFAFVFAPAAIVMGHISKKQIRQTGEQGDGLATAGLWLGYIFTGLGVLVCAFYVIAIVFAVNSSTSP
ncbi:DUF4190 domain-containing protein [Paractinoplanes lichenicola]|uniref:DUF4190 domain-containing protein n=1 Tax=Paractinoplanes lichenicola TaxID=2802976 RepID=A0ABS1VJ70_9ACTN|nr:DUF4190 domain-containing protein [Actinoplanes lichenicola]MBL7254718.1 DUF4190 domain-containing protein [Actinoplanes lichenicola]